MKTLQEILRTVNDDGVNFIPETETKPEPTLILGACNFVHTQNVFQLSSDGLPEIIEAVTQGLKDLPPESVDKIRGSLEKLLTAIAEVVAKNNK